MVVVSLNIQDTDLIENINPEDINYNPIRPCGTVLLNLSFVFLLEFNLIATYMHYQML